MKHRQLGKNGPIVSELGLGCMGLSFGLEPAADKGDGVGFVAWGPLGQGFLTGRIAPDAKFDDPSDLRSGFPRFAPEALKANFAVVDYLRGLAARKGSTPARIALAWLLAQRPWIVPIPGATKAEHLDDNLAASDLILDSEDLREIDEAFAAIDVKGAPLSEGLTAMEDR